MAKINAGAHARVTVSLVGARGYSGLELARLLLNHPRARLTHAYATQEFSLADELGDPRASAVSCLSEDHVARDTSDFVFLATPAEVSARLAPQLIARGQKVIDLSGAYRLRVEDMKAWYGFTMDPVESVLYGLQPFCPRPESSTRLIANPGCYATAVALALIPLLRQDLIVTDSLVIDAKSGTSGAGRKAGEHLLHAEVYGGVQPYRVGRHQHLPEIRETCERLGGRAIDPHFVTHLLPVARGISAGVYARAKVERIEDIHSAFAAAYDGYPLVQFGPGVERLARVQTVVHTPFTRISYTLTENKLFVFAVLDNLMKGAASQAVENLNLWLDLPSSFSLIAEEA